MLDLGSQQDGTYSKLAELVRERGCRKQTASK